MSAARGTAAAADTALQRWLTMARARDRARALQRHSGIALGHRFRIDQQLLYTACRHARRAWPLCVLAVDSQWHLCAI